MLGRQATGLPGSTCRAKPALVQDVSGREHVFCGFCTLTRHAPLRCYPSRPSRRLVAPSASTKQPAKPSKATVYPAGRKQAIFPTPACVIKVDSNEVLDQQPEFEEMLADALAGGATGVLLSDTPASTGASLYEAASMLKELLRGRATLLVADRIDIVDAADADGVLLTSKGVEPSPFHFHSHAHMSVMLFPSSTFLLDSAQAIMISALRPDSGRELAFIMLRTAIITSVYCNPWTICKHLPSADSSCWTGGKEAFQKHCSAMETFSVRSQGSVLASANGQTACKISEACTSCP